MEVWHEWNKRYEYVQLNHIRLGGAFNLLYESLKRISNGKKLCWNYNGSADFQEISFTQLDDKEIKEKILNAEEVYFLISRPEDKVVLEQGKKAKDQLIERKVWDGQLYTGIHFFGRDNVEIMGAKGIIHSVIVIPLFRSDFPHLIATASALFHQPLHCLYPFGSHNLNIVSSAEMYPCI